MTTSETNATIVHGMAKQALAFGTHETGKELALKTLTCDYLTAADGALVFEAEVVRKTRSLLFLNVNALANGTRVATGTAILSIGG